MLFCIMGPTGAGKTTLVESLEGVYPIKVGQIFRERYSPEHFKGEQAPQHTQKEAWDIFMEELEKGKSLGFEHFASDGQPRDPDQVHLIQSLGMDTMYIVLCVLKSVRRARLEARDGHDPAKLALSMSRLERDWSKIYECSNVIDAYGHPTQFLTEDQAQEAINEALKR